MAGIKLNAPFSWDDELFGFLMNNKELQQAITWSERHLAGKIVVRVERLRGGELLLTYSNGTQVSTLDY